MQEKEKKSKFKIFQDIYFKLTWVMLISSLVLLGIGFLLVENRTPAPSIIIYFLTVTLYYHFAHFGYGLLSLIFYLLVLRKKITQSKIYKTIIGILMSPVSFIAVYTALFLIAASSCSVS